MSVNLKTIDLTTVQTNFTVDTMGKSITDCGWIEFMNESPYTCDINAGGINIRVLAWERHPVQLQVQNGPVWQPYQGADFPIVVTPRLLSSANVTLFSSSLLMTLYLTGEKPTSIVPSQLNRQAYIPNQVNTMSTTSVQSSGQPNGTAFVTGFNATNSIASLVALNNGVLQLGNDGTGPHPDNGFIEINTPVPVQGTPPTGTGNVSIYEPMGGSIFATGGQIFKLVQVEFNNYRNTSTNKWTLALPSRFTNFFYILTSATPPTELLNAGTAAFINVATGIGAGGTSTFIGPYTLGSGIGSFDTLRFGASDAATLNGALLIFGI